MRLERILRAVYCEPWLILPSSHSTIRSFLDAKLGMLMEQPKREDGIGICGEVVESRQMEVKDGIAFIPVAGIMAAGLTKYERGDGLVDTQDIIKELDYALSEPSIKAAFLDIDSPGGTVAGTVEVSSAVQRFRQTKHVTAYTGGLMASAAYWLGSSADTVLVQRSAEVGSIGIYIPWVDQRQRFEQMGLSVDVIASGKYKGMGYPGTSLTDEQRAHLQARVDETAEAFFAHVRLMRGEVDDSVMQGQGFSAKSSMALGLVDSVVETRDEAIAFVKKQVDTAAAVV